MVYVVLSYLFYPLFFIAGLLRRRRPIKKILVIQPAKIGDMVCSTPVFRALRKGFPGARLTVLADPGSCGVIEANPMVDAIIPLRSGDSRGLGRKIGLASALMDERFDLSVALLPNIATTVIPLWAFIPRRLSLGPDRPGISFRLAAPLNTCVHWHRVHESILDTYARLLHEGLGLPLGQESTRMELPVTSEAMERALRLLGKSGQGREGIVVGVAPAARNKMKEVPPALYAEVADRLMEDLGARVVLIGSAADHDAVEGVLSRMRQRERAIDASGRLRLAELPALLLNLDLFISVDSGPVYMAIALGVPSINIAGPCAMEERPLGPKTRVIQKDLPCSPCSYTFHTSTVCRTGTRECVTTLTAGPVLEAAMELMARTRKDEERGGAQKTAPALDTNKATSAGSR